MADLLSLAEADLESAQDELVAAQVAALEAVARHEDAEKDVRKLEAAVAALRGEPPPASQPKSAVQEAIEKEVLTPEEWEKEQAAKRRKREKELQEQNPLAHVKCSGCGTKGSLAESYIQSPAGSPVRTLVCSKCNEHGESCEDYPR
jgi:hypothetical protein